VFSVLVSKHCSRPSVLCLVRQLPGFGSVLAGWPGSNGSTIGTNVTLPAPTPGAALVRGAALAGSARAPAVSTQAVAAMSTKRAVGDFIRR
jgi:hypothetical protein